MIIFLSQKRNGKRNALGPIARIDTEVKATSLGMMRIPKENDALSSNHSFECATSPTPETMVTAEFYTLQIVTRPARNPRMKTRKLFECNDVRTREFSVSDERTDDEESTSPLAMKILCAQIRVRTGLLCLVYKTCKIIRDVDFFNSVKGLALSQVSIEKGFYNESMDDIDAVELLYRNIQIFSDALSPLVRTLRLHREEISQNSEREEFERLSFLNKNLLIPFLYELFPTEWEETLQKETFEGLLRKINSIYEEYNDCVCNPGFLQSYIPTFQTYQNDIDSLKNLISETDPEQFANVLQSIDTYVEKEKRLFNPPVDVEGQFQEFSKWFITEQDMGCDLSSSEVLATTDMSIVYKLSQSDKSYALKEWQSTSFATQKDFDRIKNEIRATIEHQGILFVPFIGILHDASRVIHK